MDRIGEIIGKIIGGINLTFAILLCFGILFESCSEGVILESHCLNELPAGVVTELRYYNSDSTTTVIKTPTNLRKFKISYELYKFLEIGDTIVNTKESVFYQEYNLPVVEEVKEVREMTEEVTEVKPNQAER